MAWWKRSKAPVRVEVYVDLDQRWRWRAVARNGKIVGAAEQGYASKQYARGKAEQYRAAFAVEAEVVVL